MTCRARAENPEERRRLADALIRSVAFASGDAWLREFITLLEHEIVPVPDDPAESEQAVHRDAHPRTRE